MFLALLVSASLAAAASSCAPTPDVTMGPVYAPNQPFKKDICPPSEQDYVMQSTKDHPMLFREKLKRASNRLVVSGTVRSATNCEPLEGAEVDVWQSDSDGLYSPLHGDGYCRGVVTADGRGRYEFVTQEPGAYGSTRVFFGSKWVPDLPPYGPRHIHVAVWHPKHRAGVFQIYFTGDPAREFDWRSVIIGIDQAHIGSSFDNLTVSPDAQGRIEFDFVLQPLAAGKPSYPSRHAALLARCAEDETPIPALCSPGLARFLRVEVFAAATLLWLYSVYRVLRWCCCRTSAVRKRKND